MGFFLNESKDLSKADRIIANMSSRCRPTLVKLMFSWIFVGMHNPASSQISTQSLASIDTSNCFLNEVDCNIT